MAKEGVAPDKQDGANEPTPGDEADVVRENSNGKVSLAQLQTPGLQVSGFKPRVMFRLNISGTGTGAGNAASEIVCRREPDPAAHAADGISQDAVAVEPTAEVATPTAAALKSSAEPITGVSTVSEPPTAVTGRQVVPDAAAVVQQVGKGKHQSQSPPPLPQDHSTEELRADVPVASEHVEAVKSNGRADGSRARSASLPFEAEAREDRTADAFEDSVDHDECRAPARNSVHDCSSAPADVPAASEAAAPPASEAAAVATAPQASRNRKSRWDMRANPPRPSEDLATRAEPVRPGWDSEGGGSDRHQQSGHRPSTAQENRAAGGGTGPPPTGDVRGRSRDHDRDIRRDRDLDSRSRERDRARDKERDRDRDRDRERECERDRERERERDRERERNRARDRDRDRDRARQISAEGSHRGDGYGDIDRKRGRAERDAPRRYRDKYPRVDEERYRARSLDYAADRADGRGSVHGRGMRDGSAGINGANAPASAAPSSAAPPVVCTPSTCTPVRTGKPSGLMVEEEPVTPPSAAGMFTVPASQPMAVREESVTPVAANGAPEQPAARAESPATPAPDPLPGKQDATQVEPQWANGAAQSMAEMRISSGWAKGAAEVDAGHTGVGVPRPIHVESRAWEGKSRIGAEVQGSPVTPPDAIAADALAARQPFGSALKATEPADSQAAGPPAAPRSPWESGSRNAHPAAPQKQPSDRTLSSL